MKEFKGKSAVVTGAGSGIGRALARRCAAEGMRVALVDLQPARVDRVVEPLDPDLRAGVVLQVVEA